jgi:hypothetical protein
LHIERKHPCPAPCSLPVQSDSRKADVPGPSPSPCSRDGQMKGTGRSGRGGRGDPTPEELWNTRIIADEREKVHLHRLRGRCLTQYAARLPDGIQDRRERRPFLKIGGKSRGEPVWTRKWIRHTTVPRAEIFDL